MGGVCLKVVQVGINQVVREGGVAHVPDGFDVLQCGCRACRGFSYESDPSDDEVVLPGEEESAASEDEEPSTDDDAESLSSGVPDDDVNDPDWVTSDDDGN